MKLALNELNLSTDQAVSSIDPVLWSTETSDADWVITLNGTTASNTTSSTKWARTDKLITGSDIKYCELQVSTPTSSTNRFFGVAGADVVDSNRVGYVPNSIGLRGSNGLVYYGSSGTNTDINLEHDGGDTIRMWYQPSTGYIWYGVNDTVDGNPETGTNPSATMAGGAMDVYAVLTNSTAAQTNLFKSLDDQFTYSSLGATQWAG